MRREKGEMRRGRGGGGDEEGERRRGRGRSGMYTSPEYLHSTSDLHTYHSPMLNQSLYDSL